MREDTVPHEGQEAVGDVVRRVRVISSATSTSSTSISGRSGKMIIRSLSILEKVKQEKMFNLSVYHISDQQTCVSFRLSGNPQACGFNMSLAVSPMRVLPRSADC